MSGEHLQKGVGDNTENLLPTGQVNWVKRLLTLRIRNVAAAAES